MSFLTCPSFPSSPARGTAPPLGSRFLKLWSTKHNLSKYSGLKSIVISFLHSSLRIIQLPLTYQVHMLGISYGEIFLILGATAALIGPKDLPIVARTAGRLAGRAIGYVQMARGQFESVMQQSQARQVHKELQDTMAQLEAIRHEIRSISILNPGPATRRLVDNLDNASASDIVTKNVDSDNVPEATVSTVLVSQTAQTSLLTATTSKGSASKASDSSNIHSQAMAYARLAESSAAIVASSQDGTHPGELIDDAGLPNVLPVSAESAGMLPNRPDDIKGSDIVLEAILEAEVAHNAKHFFAQPDNQIKHE